MIKVCLLDTNNSHFDKLSSVFTRADLNCTVVTSNNPVELLNDIFANGPSMHVLVFPKNMTVCQGLSLRTLMMNLKKAKAPLVTLVTSSTFNHLDLLSEVEQVNYAPELPGINLVSQVMAFVSEKVKEAPKKAVIKSPADASKMFTSLMNSYMDSISAYLENYLKEKSERQNFYVKSENDPSGDISCLVSVTSQYFEGSIAVSFKDKLFLQFASAFMKDKIEELNDDCRDIITEMATEISEQFVNHMKGQNIAVSASLPMVMMGKDHKIKHISTGKIICLKFALCRSSYALEFLFQAKA